MTQAHTDKQRRRALIDPLLLMLKSRRVLIALCALCLHILLMHVPQLALLHDELLVLISALAVTLIGGISLEDAVLASRQTLSEADLRARVEALIDALFDERLLDTDSSGDVKD
ncbi:MAG: hypothetical protein ACFE0Q_01630 [Anaerolineae bacterium]